MAPYLRVCRSGQHPDQPCWRATFPTILWLHLWPKKFLSVYQVQTEQAFVAENKDKESSQDCFTGKANICNSVWYIYLSEPSHSFLCLPNMEVMSQLLAIIPKSYGLWLSASWPKLSYGDKESKQSHWTSVERDWKSAACCYFLPSEGSVLMMCSLKS